MSTHILRYAMRDLKGAWPAFRIMLLCLVLGVATLTAVQLTSRHVLDGIQNNGRTILGGDMVVRTLYKPAPDALQTWFVAQGARVLTTTELRAMLVKPVGGDSTLVELKAVPDVYPLFGALVIKPAIHVPDLNRTTQGDLPPVLLDPALEARLSVDVGDIVRLGTQDFKVAGFIEAEPDRAGGGRFGLAPRVMIGMDMLAKTGLVQQGSMVSYDMRVALGGTPDVAQMRAALDAAFPKNDWRITDTRNASPQLTGFVNRLMVFLTLVGLCSLLIGGIGIGNGTRAYFETRLRTIAIFKAIGAPARLVAYIYVLQVALITTCGIALGLVLGGVALLFAMPLLAEFLPVPLFATWPWQGFVMPAAFGFLISFAFTLWPLGQALAASPLLLFRASLAPVLPPPATSYKVATVACVACLAVLAYLAAHDTVFALWFIAGAFVSFATFWILGECVARLARHIKLNGFPALSLGLRQLSKSGQVTAHTLLSLGAGLTVLVTITMIDMNVRQGIHRDLPADAPAFFFLDIQPDQKQAFEAMLKAQPTAHTLKFSPNLRGRIVSVNGIEAEKALKDETEKWLLQNDRGFTYTADRPAHSNITSGAWWPSDYKGPPLISVVDDVERGFGVRVGDIMVLNILGREIEARVANIRSVDWTTFTINFAITFAPGTLEGAPHTWLATVVADPGQEAVIQKAITQSFPNISMIRVSDAIQTAQTIMQSVADAVRVTALVAVVTGIFVLAGSLAATRAQRLYDVVVLKVLGISPRTLRRAFLFEFAALGGVAGMLALGLGTVMSWAVIDRLMDLKWVFLWQPALVTLALALTLTLGLGWFMTGRILGQSAAPYLRND